MRRTVPEKGNRRRLWAVVVTLTGLLMAAISQIYFTSAQLAVDCGRTMSEGFREFWPSVFFIVIMYGMAISMILGTSKDGPKS